MRATFPRHILCLLCLVLIVSPAAAGIVSTNGITVVAPPDTLFEGYLESNNTIFLFPEFQAITPAASFSVDISEPGLYTSPEAVTPATFPASAPVSSYYINFDPVGSTLVLGLNGSVTFDEDILGIVLLAGLGGTPNSFVASDAIFGLPATAYASGDSLHGIELSVQSYRDAISLSSDRRTMTIDRLGTDAAADQLRIITAASVSGVRDVPDNRTGSHVDAVSPNPFNPGTTISYTVGMTSPTSLVVFDVRGRLVATLVNSVQDAGPHTATWEGLSDSGSAVSSGVYLVRLDVAGTFDTKKLLLSK